MIATFKRFEVDHKDESETMKNVLNEFNRKIERLEQRFIEEELTPELFKKYYRKYETEKHQIELKLIEGNWQKSSLDRCIDFAISFDQKASLLWTSADYYLKQKIQFLIFPEGILYNRKND